jgi:riboflavin kinase/FMN adenylyltransferase
MSTVRIDWTELPPRDFIGGAVSIGNFDGVHRGHRELVTATVSEARRVGGPAVVVTFDPPPLAVLHPPALKPPLSDPIERSELLLAAGADRVAILNTTAGLLALSPEAFFEDVILGLFQARAVVEGFNFRFGRGRTGTNATLRELCAEHRVHFVEVAPLEEGGEAVSSSRVRAALMAGDVTTAGNLLGRPYSIRGVVVEGAKRGRTIGFPTANVGKVATLVPKDGVYAVAARVRGVRYAGAANVGPNPTFGEHAQKIEVHLLDFSGDLYGAELRVEFVRRLRDTRPFAGVGELVEQLHRDVEACRVTGSTQTTASEV